MVKSPTESNQTTLAAELHNIIDTYRRILTSLVRGNDKKRRKLFKANKSTCEPHVDSFKAIYTKTERSRDAIAMPLYHLTSFILKLSKYKNTENLQ